MLQAAPPPDRNADDRLQRSIAVLGCYLPSETEVAKPQFKGPTMVHGALVLITELEGQRVHLRYKLK